MTVMFDVNAEMKARGISPMQWTLICSKLNKVNANVYPAFVFQAYDYAKARGLDILSDHIHADIRFTNNVPMLRIMTTIQGYRHIAHSSGEFAGMDAPVYGPTIVIRYGQGQELIAAEWIEVTVYRLLPDGSRAGVTAREFLVENIVYDSNGIPGPMWRKRPNGQLHVRAESQAHRKAFSKCEAYTEDEYEFADAMDVAAQTERLAEKQEPAHAKKTVAKIALEMYSMAKTNEDIVKASCFVDENGSKISGAEYEVLILAFQQASDRVKTGVKAG